MPVIARATSVEELRGQIERFNGFHDGFIKRVEIVSSDEFEDPDGMRRVVNCQVAVLLEVVHVNYQPRAAHSTGVIAARLEGVSALETKMGSWGSDFHSWSIVDASAEQAPNGRGLVFQLWTDVEPRGSQWRKELLASYICSAISFEEIENC